jgi:hypothetical protein
VKATDLERVVSQFAEASHLLTEHFQETKKPIGVAFPRGFIRPLPEIQARWPYLGRSRSRTLACFVQLCDINRWHLNIWNIGLTAGTVWEWHTAIPVIQVIEALVVEYGVLQQWFKPGTKFYPAINSLHAHGVFSEAHRDELHRLRQLRNEIHLIEKGKVEMHDGLPGTYNAAVRALQLTEEALATHWKQGARAA